MKKFIALLIAVVMVLALTACGNKEAEPEGTADDGQNPVMNFIGNYGCDRATIHVEAQGMDAAAFTVTWGSSAAEVVEWTMSGPFDNDTLSVTYSDCVKKIKVFAESGDVESEKEEYTGGHGVIKFNTNGDLTLTWQDDEENAADGMVFTYASVSDDQSSDDQQMGMANPWSEASSMEEASKAAGIDPITFVDGMTLTLGDANIETIRYMDGIVELKIPVAAVEITIRKGRASEATAENGVADGDISGDYNNYAHHWTQNIKGLVVDCYGNRDGEATKIIWSLEDYAYSITAYGMGGDEDFGLNPDDINSIINGLQ